jgi:hypothetical protein
MLNIVMHSIALVYCTLVHKPMYVVTSDANLRYFNNDCGQAVLMSICGSSGGLPNRIYSIMLTFH